MTWIGVELRAEEIEVLIRRGWLAADSRSDIAAIQTAFYNWLGDLLQ
jgi:hypothetical protein